MHSIWVSINSTRDGTRDLATAGPPTILKAGLAATAPHPRAVPRRREARAMWQGRPVRAALGAGDQDGSSATSRWLDALAGGGGGPPLRLEFVHGRKRHHDDLVDGLARFHDVRQRLMFEVAR